MRSSVVVAILLWSAAAVFGAHAQPAPAFSWTLPAHFPTPRVPPNNPMSDAKATLGRFLFYDTRLSGNGSQSCATCHEQARAFTDGRGRGLGSTGELHSVGPMSLVNIAYAASLTWGNPTVTRLEDQALVPMYGEHPVELGLDRHDKWIEALKRDATYTRLMAVAFPGEREGLTRTNVVSALATFERAIVSARSPYDRYHFDRDDTAISESAKRGEVLFHSRPLSCFTCHGGVFFSSAMGSGERHGVPEYHNTGLYNLPGLFSYPANNPALYEITHAP